MSGGPPRLNVPLARPTLGKSEEEAVLAVLRSGWLAQGPRVQAFEQALASVVEAPHAVATSSCTAALALALRLADVKAGDRVVVPSLTYIASVNAIRAVGGVPVFADVQEAGFNLDPQDVARALVEQAPVRAVLLVHQLGDPAPRELFSGLAREHGAVLVEDAACALGSRDGDRPIGARRPGEAAMACFSFHPRKVITTGEGGALVTGDADVARRARALRDQGADRSAHERHLASRLASETHGEPGFNYRMSDLSAAVGLAQLERLPAIVARRQTLAARYDDAFRDVEGVHLHRAPPGSEANRQTYAVLLAEGIDREQVCHSLLEAGVASRSPVMACHLEPACSDLAPRPLPVTERIARQALALPLYPELSESDQDAVIEHFLAALADARNDSTKDMPAP